MPPVYFRRITIADRDEVASFVRSRSLVLRWLVAFFLHLEDLPEEEESYWSLWRGDASSGEGLQIIAAHFFQTATTYVCAGNRAELGSLEDLIDEELLPERIVGDLELMERWRASPGSLLERARAFVEIDVLASGEGAGAGGEPAGFRPAVRADLPILEEYGRLYAVEAGHEFARDFESLIEHGLVFVVEGEGRVRGYVRSNLSDGEFVHAGGLYVHPPYRGKGLGRALAQGIAARAQADHSGRVILDVNRENEPAVRAYAAAGYVKLGGGLEARFDDDAWGG